ncbi:MAG TPA: Calx-beta domain-containing protein, partial [Pyrinomonadaceae bacterium]|nr:Calx-beta domain-containing protein [Pyrinomonadaceae bacterium]
GPNNLQNFPVLTSVSSIGSNTTIQGSLNSTPNTTFQIDFYTNAALDPSGNGEGAQFFNTASVTTDANGNATINASFPVALPTGRVVTATATDEFGNTSEFSAGNGTGANGQVQFSVNVMTVIEDIGLMTVTVVRTGGSAGTLTVDFATADGTAIAGQDYTATSGTLTFAGGETIKTFQVPITEDAPTDLNETFTISLRNTSNLDSLGLPNILEVIILDRTIAPTFLIGHANVFEGGPGTTTQMLVPLNLSAATGRTASVNFATRTSLAVGGTSCTPGVDFVNTSGTITFQPGTTALSIPITICGDRNAEPSEAFVIDLSNPVNGQLFTSVGTGSIVNDDVLELVLEESGPAPTQAAALDALLLVRDPFRVVGIPEWWPTTADRNTRVSLFARSLELDPGELPSAVIVRIGGPDGVVDVPAEAVQPVANSDLTEVVFRLPNEVAPGTQMVVIRAHTRMSNVGTIRIVE